MEDAIESLYRKAGFRGPITDRLLQSSSVTRYQSSIESMYYQEYCQEYKAAAAVPAASSMSSA